jgi:CRISPR-associated protein Csb2
MQLSLTVTFATDRYHGRISMQKLEWPPSPLRLFQALIAGSYRGAYDIVNRDARDRALRWLEKLEPPSIEAGQTVENGRGVLNWVPNNDDQLSHKRTEKPALAVSMVEDSQIVYRWYTAETEEAARNAAVICAMASLASHLGQHQDIVYIRGDVSRIDSSPLSVQNKRILFLPAKRIDGDWGCPSEGALEAYCAQHESILNKKPLGDFLIPSYMVDYQPSNVIRFDSPLALFELRTPSGQRLKFEPQDLRQAAAMTRNAMIEWLTANPVFRDHFGDELTSRLIGGHKPGHPEKPHDGTHIAFVPIPSLNEKATADGRIRRVLLIGYSCETGPARELFNDAVDNLNGRLLKDGGRMIGTLRRVEFEMKDPVLPLFIGKHRPSRVWRTVTPIVFTGMMRRGRSGPQLVLRALRQAGISESDVDSVAVFKGPVVPKTLRALDYRINGYLAETPRYQAEVIFRRPVIGPLLVGRGRHSGMGLMLPWSENDGVFS